MASLSVFYNHKVLVISDEENDDSEIVFENNGKIKKEIDGFWEGMAEKASWRVKNVEKALEQLKERYKFIVAAGGVIQNERGEQLFIYRRGVWDLPKGKAEKGETIEQTALREVEEETGLSGMKIIENLPSTYHMYVHKGQTILKQTYWFSMKYMGHGNLIPQTEEDIEKVVWVSRSQVEEILLNTYPTIALLCK